MSNVFRSLPSVNELLDSPPLKSLVRRVSRSVVASNVATFLDKLRTDVQHVSGLNIPTPQELAERIAQWIADQQQLPARHVINATGILLPPGLSGPPLADEAVGALASIAVNYTCDETFETHQQAEGLSTLARTLTTATGAERAVVVNNEAAAIVLTLAALAGGREVVIARSQLAEIETGSRLPDLIHASGALLREIGTTNVTRIEDYEAAAGERTAAFFQHHTSNFQMVGGSGDTSLADLVSLARRHNAPLIQHAGLGGLIDCNRYGIIGEPVISESIAAGADVVIFGGNKLLGGPRCGIIVGRQRYVDRILQHPLMAAMAAGRATLVPLMATLQYSADLSAAERALPLFSLLSTPVENLKNRAERLAPQIQATSSVAGAMAIEDETYLTGAAIPSHRLPTWGIAISPATGTVQQLAARLEHANPALLTRAKDGRLLVDLRSVQPRHDMALVAAFEALAPAPATSGEAS